MSPAETVFFAALAKIDPAERAAYLTEACGTDTDLRRQVERLLAAHPEVGSFLHEAPIQPSPLERGGPGVGGGATLDEPSTERPGTVIGPYKLLQQIGEGGMGVVWMAEQTQPVQRKVALKVIKPGMDSRQVIARFEAERQALALMDHVNIARVFDGGATEYGRLYFVMELVHGIPITKYCDDNHLTPRERLELFVPVCQAIQHAHQKGIIHRDIKPSNVMVTLYDGKPVPKVIDFGVAKATEQKLTERTLFTQYGTMVGTFEYMSPEQAEMSALGVDTRSDIYSLGVLLYELLTGSTPLTHKRMKEAAYAEILRMIKEDEPPKPSTRLSDSGEALASISANRHTEPAKLTKLVRGELDWIVMKTLEKDRSRRYETANGLALDLQHYLHDEPVQACPPSVVYLLRKFVRRNQEVVAAAALLLAVLLVGITGTTWGLIRAERARGEAVKAKDAEAEQRQAAEKSDQGTREANANLREVRDELRTNLYAARSNLIQSAWEAPGVARMRELLDEQKPHDGERDLRGFEWHYWDRRANAELTVGQPASQDEKARVNWRILSPDGRRQAIVWGGRTKIEVRDTLSGATVASFDPSIPAIARQSTISYPWLSFTSDSQGLFVLWVPRTEDRAAAAIHWWLFDAATGKELVGHREAPCEEIGPWFLGVDRSLLATPVVVAGPTKRVRLKLWSVATGKEARACEGTFAAIQWTAFRPDGKEVAAVVSSTAPEKQLVKVWDTATGRERLSLPAGSGYVRGMTWSPNGRRLTVTSTPFRIWDAVAGKELLALTEPGGSPEMVAFSSDGARMACVEPGRRFVTIKDSATGKTRTTLKTSDDTQIVGAAFTVDGRRLVTLSRFGLVRTWDAVASDSPIELPPLAASSHWDVDFSPITTSDGAGTRIAAVDGGKDQETASLQVWDTSGRSLFATKRPCRSDKRLLVIPVHQVALSPDGRRAAWVYGLGWGANTEPEGNLGVRLTLIDLPRGKDIWSQDVYSTGRLRFSPDGRWLAAGDIRSLSDAKKPDSTTVKVLDVETGRELYSYPGGAVLLNFSGDGHRLVGLGGLSPSGASWKVWDLKDGSTIMSQPCPELVTTPGVGRLAVSRDGTRLAVSWRTSDTAGIVRLLEVPSGRELRVLKGLDGSSTVAFSPDGTRLAGAGGVVKIWDTASGHDLITFRDVIGSCPKLEFSQDGHRLHAVVRSDSKWFRQTWDAAPPAMK
jgi:serine/threonine protein kinase/WD40 repeat protein